MAVSEAAIAVKAMGSHGEVAKSSEAMRRAAPRDPMVPKAIPVIARRKVFASTSRWTRPLLAPRAMRTPISRVFCVTGRPR